MALSEAAQKDLHRLAIERVDHAVESVSQLLDNHQQQFHLMLHILVAAFNAAADFAHAVHRIDGKEIPLDVCRAKVLSILAESIGFETKVITEEDAKKAGFTK